MLRSCKPSRRKDCPGSPLARTSRPAFHKSVPFGSPMLDVWHVQLSPSPALHLTTGCDGASEEKTDNIDEILVVDEQPDRSFIPYIFLSMTLKHSLIPSFFSFFLFLFVKFCVSSFISAYHSFSSLSLLSSHVPLLPLTVIYAAKLAQCVCVLTRVL